MKLGLTVGINYTGTSNELPDCVKDATDVAECLMARGFEVTTLLDGAATASVILEHLRALIAKAQYGDLAVFTYSGHGSWVPDQSGDEPDGRDEIICPADIMAGNFISDDQLHEVFSDRHHGARIVFLSDSCHSGTVHKFAEIPAIGGVPAPASSRRVRFLPPGTFMKALADRTAPDAAPPRPLSTRKVSSAALLLAGCQDTEFSFSTGTNGAFTRAYLDALAADEILSYQDWHRAIRMRLPTSEYPQTPSIQGAVYQRRWGALEEGR